jgi:hypothetical protein
MFASWAYRQPVPRFPLAWSDKLLEDTRISLAVRTPLRYVPVGVLPHFSPVVRDVLYNTYHERLIEEGPLHVLYVLKV